MRAPPRGQDSQWKDGFGVDSGPVWTDMDPARLQPILAGSGLRSQLLTYIRLRYAA